MKMLNLQFGQAGVLEVLCQQLMQENIRRTVDGMGIGAPAAPTVITNAGGNVTNAPTTNYIQQGISVRRPIILNAPTTTMG